MAPSSVRSSTPVPPAGLLDVAPAAAHERLRAWAEARALPRYRVDQMLRRLWTAPIGAWSEASELPATLRAELDREFPLPRLAADVVQASTDGTQKFLWRLADGEAIESVLIP